MAWLKLVGAEWLALYSAARSTPQLTTRAERGLIGKPDELPADSATGTSTVGPLMVKSAAQPSCRCCWLYWQHALSG